MSGDNASEKIMVLVIALFFIGFCGLIPMQFFYLFLAIPALLGIVIVLILAMFKMFRGD